MQDGLWEFDDTGVAFGGYVLGRFVGWVEVSDSNIRRLWIETTAGPYIELARGSWLWSALATALQDDLPDYIASQKNRDQHHVAASQFLNELAMHAVCAGEVAV